MERIEIPHKLPSLNDYILACRSNRYAGASMKKKIQKIIAPYMVRLPRYEKPIKIHFHWVEGNKKRDFDNICASKKFILDTLVEIGKLKDDNRKCVTAFTDTFGYGDSWKVILEIEEVEDENND